MRAGIHPPTLAAMNRLRVGDKYRPSNGTEGDYFFDEWCSKCARDNHLREDTAFEDCLDGVDGDLCEIIGRTFMYELEDAKYPAEWQYGTDGQPCCTAFVPKGQPIPPLRCPHTVDMFQQPAEVQS